MSGLEDTLFTPAAEGHGLCPWGSTGASEKGTRAHLFPPPVEGKLIRGFEGLDVGD